MAVIAAGVTEIPPARGCGAGARGRAEQPGPRCAGRGRADGARAELRLVESVAECPPAAVDEALASGLLTVDGARLGFRHEIARLAVEQAISPRRRRRYPRPGPRRPGGWRVRRRRPAGLSCRGRGGRACRGAVRLGRRAAGGRAGLAPRVGSAVRAGAAVRGPGGPGGGRRNCTAVSPVSWAARPVGGRPRRGRALTWAVASGRRPAARNAALQQLSVTMWRLCRGAESRSAAEAAVAVARTARAEHRAGLGLCPPRRPGYGRRPARGRDGAVAAAQALAESLGVRGCSATRSTPRRVPSPTRAETGPTRCARRCRSPSPRACRHRRAAPTRTCTKSTAVSGGSTRLRKCFAEGIAYCDEHDIGTFSACLRGERASALEKTGRWEESASLSMETAHPGRCLTVNRINPLTSLGTVRARQGTSSCWGWLDEAAATAEGSGEPQHLVLGPTGPRRSALAGGRASRGHTRSRAGR